MVFPVEEIGSGKGLVIIKTSPLLYGPIGADLPWSPCLPLRAFAVLEWLLPELTRDACSLVLENLAVGVISPR